MNSAVAAVLRAETAALGLSQPELERRSGIPVVSLQRYLKDKRPITIDVLDAMARALDMTITQVFEEAERRRGRPIETDDPEAPAPPPDDAPTPGHTTPVTARDIAAGARLPRQGGRPRPQRHSAQTTDTSARRHKR